MLEAKNLLPFSICNLACFMIRDSCRVRYHLGFALNYKFHVLYK
jgi:hypothetical protein